jgi:flagellar P-ring protein precursor FlgI
MRRYLFLAALILAVALPAPGSPAGNGGPARVVIDQRTGAVVITGSVRLSRVAVSTGGLTVRVTEEPMVSQPGPFSRTGKTVVTPRTRVQVDEGGGTGKGGRLVVLPENATLDELVTRLNRLGLKPGELIQVLQAIKQAGALQAEIVVK